MTYKQEHDLNHNKISPEHRYSCYNKPFSNVIEYRMADGWTLCGKRNMVKHVTEWLDIKCGHSFKQSDPGCSGCYRR